MRITSAQLARCWSCHAVSAAFVQCLIVLLPILMLASNPAGAADLDQPIQFNIPSQTPLDDALIEWGRRTGMQVMIAAQAAAGRISHGVNGTLSARAALELLLKDSGLTYTAEGSTVRIAPSRDPRRVTKDEPGAEADPGKTSSGAEASGPPGDPVGEAQKQPTGQRVELEEVIVTGTHLRSVAPISPVVTLTHEELTAQGYTSLEDALQQLPQSFSGGGATPSSNGILAVGNGAQLNSTYSSGVNLRGLGTGATLVLLNGKRLPETSYGQSTDISHIPLSAIDRVEIVTDGASAIYGSDAIAGVVNIITKKDFEGVESEVRVGNVAAGKGPDTGGAITGGFGWSGGNALATVDYERASPLFARARDFISSLPDPTTLIPQQDTLSTYAAIRQSVTANLTLSSAVLLSRRDFMTEVFYPGTPFTDSGRSNQGIVSAEADYKLGHDWLVTLAGQFSRETDPSDALYTGLLTDTVEFSSGTSSGELRLEGPLASLPAGSARAALGVSYRTETFNETATVDEVGVAPSVTDLRLRRRDTAAYGEFAVPLIGGDNAVPGVHELTFDFAGRYDQYSDFGHTFNPKAALKWAVTDAIIFHGTYARSFRAPPLYLLSLAANNVAVVADLTDPSSPTGARTGLLIDSNNPNLKPELATSRTAGLELKPPAWRNFDLQASWFEIDYRQRIEELFSQGFFTNVIEQASVLGSLINLAPSLEEVEQQLDVPGRTVLNFTGQPFTAGSIHALADVGYVNVGESRIRGIDQSARYTFDAPLGRVSTNLDTSYLLTYDNRITPASHAFSILNTPYNPPRWRAKLNVGWSLGELATFIRLNQVGSYRDPSDPRCSGSGCHVGSWTTFDIGVAYTVQHPIRDLRLSLGAFNVLNRAPPFLNNQLGEVGSLPGVNYDPVNASALNRTFQATLSKRW